MNRYDRQHLRNIAGYERLIDELFNAAASDAANIAEMTIPFDFGDEPLNLNNHPLAKLKYDELVRRLNGDIKTVIVNGVNSEWTLSNNKNNELCRQVFGDNVGKLTEAQYRRYYSTNGNARDAFLQRTTNGLRLSDRVWNYTSQFKDEIEMGLDLGIRHGLAADEMAKELLDFLKYPDKLFRRVRDEHGQLRLSQKAAAFHPGRGVYRSSYMNARRLAATETNMAYRTADHERWQQLDFVVGIRVSLSNNHNCKGFRPGTFSDICDELSAPYGFKPDDKSGLYPKDFKFTGWHPHCRCIATAVLKTEEELDRDLQLILDGGEPAEGGANEVTIEQMRGPKVEISSLVTEYVKNPTYDEKKYKPIYDAIEQWKEGQRESKTLMELIEASEFKGSLYRGMSLTKEEYNELHKALYVDKKNATAVINKKRAITSWTDDQDIASGWYTDADADPDKVRVVFQINGRVRGRKLDGSPIGNEDGEVVLSKYTKLKTVKFGRTVVKDQYGEYILIKLEPQDTTVTHKVVKAAKASANEVTDLPQGFKQWVRDNRQRIATAKSKPYFITDNQQRVDGILSQKPTARKTPLEIAAERHAARTAAQIADIKARWRDRTLMNEMPNNLTVDEKKAILANNKEIEKTLGITKGKPMTFTEADGKAVNPMYGQSETYSNNCQTCTVAYELRRRGFAVKADTQTTEAIFSRLGMTWKSRWHNPDGTVAKHPFNGCTEDTAAARRAFIEAEAKDIGRYEVYCMWKGKKSAHVFIVERQKNGALTWYDPQTARRGGAFDDYLNAMVSECLSVLRIDDKLINTKMVSRFKRSK